MKKIALLGTFLLLNVTSILAQNCKPFYEGEDEFTMEKQKVYGNFFNSSFYSTLVDKDGTILYLLGKKGSDNKFYVAIQLRFAGAVKADHSDWFKSGVKFMIKLEKEILTFIAKKPEFELEKARIGDKLLSDRKNENRFTIVYLESEATKEQIEKISKQDIEKIRYYVFPDSEDLKEDVKVEKVRLNKVQSQFECLSKQ